MGSPDRVASLPPRTPPECALLGDQEAIADVTALLLVVETPFGNRSRSEQRGP